MVWRRSGTTARTRLSARASIPTTRLRSARAVRSTTVLSELGDASLVAQGARVAQGLVPIGDETLDAEALPGGLLALRAEPDRQVPVVQQSLHVHDKAGYLGVQEAIDPVADHGA